MTHNLTVKLKYFSLLSHVLIIDREALVKQGDNAIG